MATEEMQLSQQRTPGRLAKTPEDARSLCSMLSVTGKCWMRFRDSKYSSEFSTWVWDPSSASPSSQRKTSSVADSPSSRKQTQ